MFIDHLTCEIDMMDLEKVVWFGGPAVSRGPNVVKQILWYSVQGDVPWCQAHLKRLPRTWTNLYSRKIFITVA